jgi:hypothetical protein
MQPGIYPPPAPKKRSKGLAITLIIVGSLVGLCAVCGIGAMLMSKSGDDNDSTSSAKNDGDGKAAQAAGLNTAVRDGKFEFVVSAVDCGKTEIGSQYLNKKAQGQFCVVTLSVKNIGTKAQTFFLDNQKGTTTTGAECAPDSLATIYASGEQSTWIEQINPGNGISGPIVYDIPAGEKIAKLTLHDSAFSGGVSVTVG